MEKSSTDGYLIIFLCFAWSPFPDFESSRGTVVDLDNEDIQLFLKQYNSIFVTYNLTPGFYKIKDIAEALYPLDSHEGTLKIEYDDITIKTKLN